MKILRMNKHDFKDKFSIDKHNDGFNAVNINFNGC